MTVEDPGAAEIKDRDKQKEKVFKIQLALPLLVRPGQGWQLEGKAQM